MITGEVTEDLEEMLHRAPQNLINLIFNMIEVTSDKKPEETGRKEKETILLSDNPLVTEEQMNRMDLSKFITFNASDDLTIG